MATIRKIRVWCHMGFTNFLPAASNAPALSSVPMVLLRYTLPLNCLHALWPGSRSPLSPSAPPGQLLHPRTTDIPQSTLVPTDSNTVQEELRKDIGTELNKARYPSQTSKKIQTRKVTSSFIEGTTENPTRGVYSGSGGCSIRQQVTDRLSEMEGEIGKAKVAIVKRALFEFPRGDACRHFIEGGKQFQDLYASMQLALYQSYHGPVQNYEDGSPCSSLGL